VVPHPSEQPCHRRTVLKGLVSQKQHLMDWAERLFRAAGMASLQQQPTADGASSVWIVGIGRSIADFPIRVESIIEVT
jgi:hypothetical protein